MNRLKLLAGAFFLLVSTLACSTLAAGGQKSGGVDVEVVNQSPDSICYVLISPSDDDSWGDDQLGQDETIEPGNSRVFNMGQGTYDVRAESCDEAAMATAWEVSRDTTLTVGERGADIRLVVANGSDVDACFVYISQSSADDWGEDWMGDGEVIQPDGQRVFYLESDVYDLRVSDCDDQVLVEEYSIDLSEDTVWTLQN